MNNELKSANCEISLKDIEIYKKKADIVNKLMSIVPFGNIETHTIDNLVERIEWFIQDHCRLYSLEEERENTKEAP